MRILLALLVLVAAVVALVLLLPSRTAPAVVEPVAVRPPEPSAPDAIDFVRPESRTENERSAGVEPVTERPIVATSEGECRVEIVLLGSPAGFKPKVDARCTDALGREVAHEVAGPTSWLIPRATAGEYHVVLQPHGAELLPATARFEVGPAERAKRVELTLQRARLLRVRWQADDERPIVMALRQPGVLLGPALLQVALATERTPAGQPAPPSTRSVFYNVNPEIDLTEEAPQLPGWAGSPPDGFALLSVPLEGPCAVNASIGGQVVESADVRPDTSEIVFRTHLDVVRRARATVRFCLVAAESGRAIPNAVFAVNTHSGIGYGSVEVGPDGCREDPRLLAGGWTLIIHAHDRTPIFREIDLAPGDVLELGTIAMQKECPLLVRLTLPDGRPATGVTGMLIPSAQFALGHRKGAQLSSGGLLSFNQVTDEEQAFVVFDERWACTPRLVPRCAPDRTRDELAVQLEEGIPIALDLGPAPPYPPTVLVYAASDLPAVTGLVSPTGIVPLYLAPGEYFVVRPGRAGAHAFRVGRESVVIDVRE